MLRLDVISFIDILLTLSRHLKRHFSNHRDKIYIYIKFLNRFKFDCTTIILPYLLLREMWFESNQPRKYRKRLAQYRENKGMSIPRTTSAPPFGVNNWPAMRDGISSTGFLPIELIASWNYECSHGWTWHVGKKSFRITAHAGLRMASIERRE